MISYASFTASHVYCRINLLFCPRYQGIVLSTSLSSASDSVTVPDDDQLEEPLIRTKITQPKSLYITRGTPAFIRVTLALFSAGLATFALLYCVQPILPVLSQDFGISPATSSLSLSIATIMLAVGLLFTGPLSDTLGRKNVMVVSLLLAAFCTLICAFMTSWHGVLLMRALIGLSLSGVAAVAMSYLSEEIHPSFLAFSMGLYISGNSIGGMSGRLVTGVLTDYFPWRIAIGAMGILALLAALMFWRILPESRHFRPGSLRPKSLLINTRLHWHDAGLPWLFLQGFLLMGAFVTLFNYIGYRLLAPPYTLNQAIVGLLSVVYLTGSLSSPRAGAMTARYGRGAVMAGSVGLMLAGLGLTAFGALWLIFIGMMLFTAGFFAAHAVASGWIGVRARRARGQASSMYLFCYYLGSSLAGTLGGLFWSRYGWLGVSSFIGLLLLVALYVSLHLRRQL